MSALNNLAEFIVSADVAALPAAERDIMQRHVTDTVLARHAGARAVEFQALRQLAGDDAASADGIAGLAASVRLTEIDDIHIGSCSTVSSVTVPVALALAAAHGAGAKTTMAAIWAGTDLVVRLGKAIDGANVLYQGIWPTRVAAPLGAAAVACRVQGLDVGATVHALSLALMMTPSRIGRIAGSPSGRWVLFMAAIGDGLRAARAAQQGFTGDPGLLDGDWLQRLLGVPVDVKGLTRDLGASSVYPELSLKPYCTSRQALSAADAMRALMRDGLDPATISSVKVRVPNAYSGMISTRLQPSVRTTSYVSAGAMMAVAALAPKHLYDLDRDSIIGDPAIKALADKVTVEADASLDRQFPAVWPADVEVETSGGTRRVRVDHPAGDPGNRLDDAGWLEKAGAVLAHLKTDAGAGASLLELGRRAYTDDAACRRLAQLFVDAALPASQ